MYGGLNADSAKVITYGLILMTRNRMRVAIESGKGMKMKVLEWC